VVPLCSDKVSRASPYSRLIMLFTRTGLSPTMVNFSKLFWFLHYKYWPDPRSLVTTSRVSFDFFSSGYLDISVLRVCFFNLFIQLKIPPKRWVSPFRNPRVKGYWHLTAAYRSLSRLSSPPTAKASIKCSSHF
jgi:hypothetical protein